MQSYHLFIKIGSNESVDHNKQLDQIMEKYTTGQKFGAIPGLKKLS